MGRLAERLNGKKAHVVNTLISGGGAALIIFAINWFSGYGETKGVTAAELRSIRDDVSSLKNYREDHDKFVRDKVQELTRNTEIAATNSTQIAEIKVQLRGIEDKVDRNNETVLSVRSAIDKLSWNVHSLRVKQGN